MNLSVYGFDWDAGNRQKCQNHGLSLREIEAFFRQNTLYVAPDLAHSDDEQRFIAMGRSSAGHPMFVAFTLRGDKDKPLIRPISARYMHKREVDKYEEAFPEDDK